MQQIFDKKTAINYGFTYICEAYGKEIDYKVHMLLVTDKVLERSVNITSTDEEILKVACKV